MALSKSLRFPSNFYAGTSPQACPNFNPTPNPSPNPNPEPKPQPEARPEPEPKSRLL